MIAIASDSMVSTFARGDAIIFEKIEKNEIKKGDIIVFKRDKKLVSHRVIDTKESSSIRYFQTKGDANKSPDVEWTSEKNTLGVVRRAVKYIGYPTVLINELFGR